MLDIPDTSCWLLKDQVLFGSYPYPPKSYLKQLHQLGIDVFVSLVAKGETTRDGTPLEDYTAYLNEDDLQVEFPISDRRTPKNLTSLKKMLRRLSKLLTDGHRLYIHCRGGHGRAGLICALLLRVHLGYTPDTALEYVKKQHRTRVKMEPRFRKMGAPQTAKQKEFVRTLEL